VCWQLAFIRAYLEMDSSSKRLNGCHEVALDAGDCVGDHSDGVGDHVAAAAAAEEAVLLEANAYALASHFLWALWSVIQSNISTIQFAYLVRTSLLYRAVLSFNGGIIRG